jgi:hypothetical protein
MYAEDMDLCFKVIRAGLRVYHVPAAEVIHHGGASSSVQGSNFSAVMMRDALCTYMVLNHGPLSALTYRFASGLSALARILVLLPGLLLGDKGQRRTRSAAVARWWAVLSWSCGGQKWTRRYHGTQPGVEDARA